MTQQPPIAEGLQQVMGASATQTGLSQAEPEVSALRASIPSAIDALEVLVETVNSAADWLAYECKDAKASNLGAELLLAARQAEPSLIYPYQRAAIAIRNALGRHDEDWRVFVPAAFAALLAAPASAIEARSGETGPISESGPKGKAQPSSGPSHD